MEFFDFSCDEILNLLPEHELLNYLTWAKHIFNCQQSWDIDSLCVQMDLDGQDNVRSNSSENSIMLDSTEIKNILLSNNSMKRNIEIFVKVLLKFIMNKIENYENDYKEVLAFIKEICYFVKVCEKNNIIVVPLKTHVTKFLSDLFSILGTADAYNFTVKGPVYQLIIKIIGSFKKIEFARSFVVTEISRRVKSFYSLVVKIPANNFDMSSYEILLLHVMILKEVLEYNLQQLLLKSTKVNKKEDNTLMDVNQKLISLLDKLPDYVAFAVQDCLSLLF